MTISILTLFPEMFQGPFSESIVKLAAQKGLITINLVNIRDFGIGKHNIVDDTPYGGGVGMIMRVDVLHSALNAVRNPSLAPNEEKVILMTADGKKYTQKDALSYANLKHLIILCGHYEGVDERIREYIDEEISIGDFVLTGGEIPAMLVTDSVTRLIDGVLKPDATSHETFSLPSNGSLGLLEYPIYTRPAEYQGKKVPDVLISGNHANIATWREEESKKKTTIRRPDLR
jgi:tRNA (guanine37-N1)-methyltransferase